MSLDTSIPPNTIGIILYFQIHLNLSTTLQMPGWLHLLRIEWRYSLVSIILINHYKGTFISEPRIDVCNVHKHTHDCRFKHYISIHHCSISLPSDRYFYVHDLSHLSRVRLTFHPQYPICVDMKYIFWRNYFQKRSRQINIASHLAGDRFVSIMECLYTRSRRVKKDKT